MANGRYVMGLRHTECACYFEEVSVVLKMELSENPNLEILKNDAEALLQAYHNRQLEAMRRFNESHPRASALTKSNTTLDDAQLVLAREYSFDSWQKLKGYVSAVGSPSESADSADGDDDVTMALIPAGEFRMGIDMEEIPGIVDREARELKSKAYAEADRDWLIKEWLIHETPCHTVYLDAFYLDVHPVTNEQFKRFIDANLQWSRELIPGYYHQGSYLNGWNAENYPSGCGNHPVTHVSRHAVVAYAAWVGKRLPTEAEWEKAARGGLVGRRFPWGDDIDNVQANYNQRSERFGVCRYPKNGYGLHDMVGTVFQWCSDYYAAGYYQNSPTVNPEGPEFGENYVIQGGSHRYGVGFGPPLRVSYRERVSATEVEGDIGFRCAKDA